MSEEIRRTYDELLQRADELLDAHKSALTLLVDACITAGPERREALIDAAAGKLTETVLEAIRGGT